MPEQKPKLKFHFGNEYHIKLLYDSPKTGEGQYGTWWLYGVEYNGEEHSVFASKSLNERLEHYRKGDKVIVQKLESDQGYPYYDVMPEEGYIPSGKDAPREEAPDWNKINTDKTKDIHRQVCLKLAVQSMGTSKKDLDLAEVATRMNGLLTILDGLIEEEPEEVQDEIPTPKDEDLPF